MKNGGWVWWGGDGEFTFRLWEKVLTNLHKTRQTSRYTNNRNKKKQKYVQIHKNTYKYMQIHTNTCRYIQIHTKDLIKVRFINVFGFMISYSMNEMEVCRAVCGSNR